MDDYFFNPRTDTLPPRREEFGNRQRNDYSRNSNYEKNNGNYEKYNGRNNVNENDIERLTKIHSFYSYLRDISDYKMNHECPNFALASFIRQTGELLIQKDALSAIRKEKGNLTALINDVRATVDSPSTILSLTDMIDSLLRNL